MEPQEDAPKLETLVLGNLVISRQSGTPHQSTILNDVGMDAVGYYEVYSCRGGVPHGPLDVVVPVRIEHHCPSVKFSVVDDAKGELFTLRTGQALVPGASPDQQGTRLLTSEDFERELADALQALRGAGERLLALQEERMAKRRAEAQAQMELAARRVAAKSDGDGAEGPEG